MRACQLAVLACCLRGAQGLDWGLVEEPLLGGGLCPKPSGVARCWLQKSADGELRRVTRRDVHTRRPVVVARSYDGGAWDGVLPQPLDVACREDSPRCYFTWDSTAYEYTVSSVRVTPPQGAPGDDAVGARLLLQGTFGPTRAALAEYAALKVTHGTHGAAAAAWFDAQTGYRPRTSAVRHVRQRMNPPLCDAYFEKGFLGAAYEPCDVGARWHRHAIADGDVGALVTIPAAPGDVVLHKVGLPIVITEIEEALVVGVVPGGKQVPPGDYNVCPPERSSGAWMIRIAPVAAGGCELGSTILSLRNPPVRFTRGAPPAGAVLDFDMGLGNIAPVAGMDEYAGVAVATTQVAVGDAERAGVCNNTGGFPALFVKAGGAYYRYDRRLRLVENTVDRPATVPPGGAPARKAKFSCPSAEVNFMNEGGCVRTGAGACGVRCGSREEVANDPLLGDRYSLRFEANQDFNSPCGGTDWPQQQPQVLSTPFQNFALRAPDQLRVRVAWALVQMVPISLIGVLLPEDVLIWQTYLDIFLAHAFGNYRDILKEVSYHTLMGNYLSFERNWSFESSGNQPDQNYAREVMQLFSVGLWMLHRDGSEVRDEETGEAVPTYHTRDVVSLSRAWTGFYKARGRANSADLYGTNAHDPMRIEPRRRDALPKTDILGGYVGDAYPLCSDAPARAFLKAGAEYRLVGDEPAETDKWVAWHDEAYADLTPPGVAVKVAGPATCPSWSYCATKDPSKKGQRARFQVAIEATAEHTKPASGVEQWIHGDNGAVMKIRQVEHFAAGGSVFQFAPLAYNSEAADYAALLADFNTRFPVGTTLTVHNSPTIGAPPPRLDFYTVRTGPLFAALCGGPADACAFPVHVRLPEDLACGDAVCGGLDALGTVRVVSGGTAVYYAHVQAPCVRLAVVGAQEGRVTAWKAATQCADPRGATAGATCCPIEGGVAAKAFAPPQCLVLNELMRFETARARCAALGLTLCPPFKGVDEKRAACGRTQHTWFDVPCGVQVEVRDAGLVNLVAPEGGGDTDPRLAQGSGNVFYPRWEPSGYPAPRDGEAPPAGCTVATVAEGGASLLCSAITTLAPLYTTVDDLLAAGRDRVAAAVTIGAFPPDLNDMPHRHSDASVDIAVHVREAGVVDARSVIAIRQPPEHGGGYRWYRNAAAWVELGHAGSGFKFRNPPAFMPLSGEAFTVPTLKSWDFHARFAAAAETDALLDHLFLHPSTAPFVARLLIQRLVTSNPSPRYVEAAATAFATGDYDGRGSGRYGCMTALVAAVLLDREARSPTLDADPTHGATREPLVRVVHFLRALEYESRAGQDVALQLATAVGQDLFHAPSVFGFYLPTFAPRGVVERAGLASPEATLAPAAVTLLNGLLSLARYGLTSCEDGFGGRATAPGWSGRDCKDLKRWDEQGSSPWPWGKSDGALTLDPRRTPVREGTPVPLSPTGFPDAAYGAYLVAQYDTLLTGGRLSAHSRRAVLAGLPLYTLPVTDATADLQACTGGFTLQRGVPCGGGSTCDQCIHEERGDWKAPPRGCGWHPDAKSGATPYFVADPAARPLAPCASRPDPAVAQAAAKQAAVELMMAVPEFHTTNLPRPAVDAATGAGEPRRKRPRQAKSGAPYKAVVAIMLEGGADSFNYIVPGEAHACRGNLSYDHYAGVRQEGLRVPRELLKDVDLKDGHNQPCDSFYMPVNLSNIHAMWEAGDAAMFLNTGSLVDPVDRHNVSKGRTPPALFAHNLQQRHAATLHAQNAQSGGVLGRIVDALAYEKNDRTNLYDMDRLQEITRGETDVTVLNRVNGVRKLTGLDDHREAMSELVNTAQGSLFAESFMAGMQQKMDEAEGLGAMLDAAPPLATGFDDDNVAGLSLQSIAKVISLRSADGERLADRDVFSFQVGGFDTHKKLYAPQTEMVDRALGHFKEEMMAQGVWDDVAVVVYSEFGRSLLPNGRGTDHAWGGNYFVLGGSVRPHTVVGSYPTALDGSDRYDFGHGIMIPSTPFEALWMPVAEWLGVPQQHMAGIFPNAANLTTPGWAPGAGSIFGTGGGGGGVDVADGAKDDNVAALVYILLIAAAALGATWFVFRKRVATAPPVTVGGNDGDGPAAQSPASTGSLPPLPGTGPLPQTRAAAAAHPAEAPLPAAANPNPLGLSPASTSRGGPVGGMLGVPRAPGAVSHSSVTTVALASPMPSLEPSPAGAPAGGVARFSPALIASTVFFLRRRDGVVLEEMEFLPDGRARTASRPAGSAGTWRLTDGPTGPGGYPILSWAPYPEAVVQLQLMNGVVLLLPPIPTAFCPDDAEVTMRPRAMGSPLPQPSQGP